jgi:hypothetical protein
MILNLRAATPKGFFLPGWRASSKEGTRRILFPCFFVSLMSNLKFFRICLVLGFFGLFASQARSVVISEPLTISATNRNYEGIDLMVSNAAVRIEGAHAFGELTTVSNATVTVSATNLILSGLWLRNSSRFELAGGAVLQVEGSARVQDTATLLVFGRTATRRSMANGSGLAGQFKPRI